MTNKISRKFYVVALMVIMIMAMFGSGHIYAADGSTDYMQYQEPKPSAGSSWLSTIAYVLTLIFTFAVVIGLAYFASKFLGKNMAGMSAIGNNKIISTLGLGPNKAIYIVEIAGKYLVLGVTEQNINVLQEITDIEEINKIKADQLVGNSNEFDKIFKQQLASLQQFKFKFPVAFGDEHTRNNDNGEKR